MFITVFAKRHGHKRRSWRTLLISLGLQNALATRRMEATWTSFNAHKITECDRTDGAAVLMKFKTPQTRLSRHARAVSRHRSASSTCKTIANAPHRCRRRRGRSKWLFGVFRASVVRTETRTRACRVYGLWSPAVEQKRDRKRRPLCARSIRAGGAQSVTTASKDIIADVVRDISMRDLAALTLTHSQLLVMGQFNVNTVTIYTALSTFNRLELRWVRSNHGSRFASAMSPPSRKLRPSHAPPSVTAFGSLIVSIPLYRCWTQLKSAFEILRIKLQLSIMVCFCKGIQYSISVSTKVLSLT